MIATDTFLSRPRGRARPTWADKPDLWLSDDRADRAIAATLCAGCRILTECAAAADAADARFGVWAGVDRTEQPGKPRPHRRR